MATIADLLALGYECGLASGSVTVEEDALAAAQLAADPQTIADQANVAVAETVQALTTLGKVPTDEEERLQMFAQIGETAYKLLTEHASEKLAFHQRALEIAKTMPNTWHVTGPGFTGYVACKDDGTGWDTDHQAMLDALADPTAHAERCFQSDNPDAMAAAHALAADGKTVERDPGSDTFTVDGNPATVAQIVKQAGNVEPTK